MRKIVFIPFLCLCAVLLFAGCGTWKNALNNTVHDVLEEISQETMVCWQAAGTDHTHIYEDSLYCSDCGALCRKNRDGSFSVWEREPYRRIDYDAEGNVIAKTYRVYEYYENGDEKLFKEYVNDVLSGETHFVIYEVTEYSTVYQKEEIIYAEDGGKIIHRYHPTSEFRTSTEHYDSEGNLISTERFECSLDGKGRVVKEIGYVDDVLSYEVTYFSDSNTYLHRERATHYAEDGTVEREYTYAYEFDSSDAVTRITVKLNGQVCMDAYYTKDSQGRHYCNREITYDESGRVLTDVQLDVFGVEVKG